MSNKEKILERLINSVSAVVSHPDFEDATGEYGRLLDEMADALIDYKAVEE